MLELPFSLPPERSQGRGVLELTVLLPERSGFWALKIPCLASANRVTVTGQDIGGAGSLDPYQARYHPQELLFEAPTGRAEISIAVANFHHRRMRLNRLYVGHAEEITRYSMNSVTRDGLILGSLLFLAFYHLAVFVLYPRETALGYFAGIALLTAMRLGITGERLIVRLWPLIPPELMMKIGYAPTFLLLPVIVLYLRALSSDPILHRLGHISRWVPVPVYDAVFQYGIAVILLLAVAVLLFLLLQAYFLAWRIHTPYQRTQEQASTIQEFNRTLEARIATRTAELADANRQLEAMSRTDGLTGVANRRHFDEVLEREWHRAQRNGTPITLIMTDVDKFKPYNDTYGHVRGDECLKAVSRIYAGAVRR